MKYLCLSLYFIATELITTSKERILFLREDGTTAAATQAPIAPGITSPAGFTNLTLQRSVERFLKALGPWDGKRPDIGYLPYWTNWDWVMYTKANKTKKTKATKPGETTIPTARVTGMCGEPCPIRYKRYGYICARNKRNLFKSFKNLCDLHNADCSGKIGWMIVYRGNCSQEFFGLFPTVTVHQHAMELMSNFFSTTRITTVDLSKEEVSDPLVSSESYLSPEEDFRPEANEGKDWIN